MSLLIGREYSKKGREKRAGGGNLCLNNVSKTGVAEKMSNKEKNLSAREVNRGKGIEKNVRDVNLCLNYDSKANEAEKMRNKGNIFA